MRLACLQLPLFPLAARLRSEPDLAGEALVVTAGDGPGARVVAASRRARQAEVRTGLTLAQARALLPGLVARPRDAECERAAQEALLETAEAFSPRVEDAGGGTAYLDLEGLERHFRGGPRQAEEELGRALAAAAEKVGLPARVGVAGSKLAARVAAGLSPTPVVVPPGEEAAFLAPLPLASLDPAEEVAATLASWGVRSAGDFARLPAAEVAGRLGRAGEELHAVAEGRDPRPLTPREPSLRLREGTRLEWPLVNLEPFLFLARTALERLCGRLEARGLACLRLELSLDLEPDGHDERAVELPAPTREVKSLLTLVRLDLEARPPGAPVTAFAFTACPDRPPEAQLTLFGPAAFPPGRLAATLARLFALLGPDRVGSPRTLDGHRPEAFRLVDFDPPPPPESTPPAPAAEGRGLLAVRVLRPPVELEVITAGGPAEVPSDSLQLLEVRSTSAAETAKRPRVTGRVRVASGPWGLSEQWWSEGPVERDYWDVELAGGGLYRIYRDRATGEWWADGIYD